MKIKSGDEVKIIRGKESGKTGKVTRVYTKENSVVVEGMNQYKRHVKAKTQTQKSEIVTITKPLPVTNVALLCPSCKKETRVGYTVEKGIKTRICRKCGKGL